jgi:hypothetical protein
MNSLSKNDCLPRQARDEDQETLEGKTDREGRFCPQAPLRRAARATNLNDLKVGM